MRVDTFMFNNELDMLECRLVEIFDDIDYVVAVEADVDHQDHPKPYILTENLSRFDAWKDKLRVVRATGLPSVKDYPDPWAREHAQREHTVTGLADIGVSSTDIVLHGDVDEIPTGFACRLVQPRGFVAFEQRGHFWSLRWQYPYPWMGTVAARAGNVESFGAMRDRRNITPVRMPHAGWHLSWLPNSGESSLDSATRKVGSFCHPEVEQRIRDGLASEKFLVDGVHVDGAQMSRVEIDHTFPKWVREGNCPAGWLQ